MKVKKYSITKELFADMRLSPLNQLASKAVLQLFISKITDGDTISFKVLYGWCIVTSRPEISADVTIGTFEKVYSSKEVIYEVVKLSVYQHSDVIVKLLNQLLDGKTFKQSANPVGVKTDKIKFDFTLEEVFNGNIRIRPIIFNETMSYISRNMFEKYALHSPFGNTPSFTLSIVNLDKLSIVKNATGIYSDHKKIILKILEHLSLETKLSFSTTESARFGNIEFINGPCANIYERTQVHFENISKEEAVDGIKEKSSRQVKVTILPNEQKLPQKLLVNCFSTNGGQIILDEIKEVLHESSNTIVVEFDTLEPITAMVVSIWIKEDRKWQIWFKHSCVLARDLVTRIGTVGSVTNISSPFLSRVLSAGSHLKDDVAKAKVVNKTSYQTTSTSGYRLDPWVKADQDFNMLVKSIVPEKSEAEFFSKGWSSEVGEHGALAFLEWFKKICDRALNVIVQDPYFDTVGLEFLARTSNITTSFTVITCTQTPSTDDEEVKAQSLKQWFLNKFTRKVEMPLTPNRATRLIDMLQNFPQIFAHFKLTVHDYRNKSKSVKNLLHDRYIIVYATNQEPKGFHLSNSIQNATQNYPLLITPIPLDVLKRVEKYCADLIEDGNQAGTYDMLKLYDHKERETIDSNRNTEFKNRPIDENLFAELKLIEKEEIPRNYSRFSQIFETYIANNELKFDFFWDTFGYFLANISSGDEILHHVKEWFSPTKSYLLKQYLLRLAKGEALDKFKVARDIERSGYHLLFIDDFDYALNESLRAESYFYENFGFGNYAAGYASWVLLNIDIAAFESLVKEVRSEIQERRGTENLSEKAILIVAAILFTDLAREVFWYGHDDNIDACIRSEILQLRVLAIAVVLKGAVNVESKISFEKVKEFFFKLSFEEEVKAYVSLVHQSRFTDKVQQDKLQDNCFEKLLQLLKVKSGKIIFQIVDTIIAEKYFESMESITTSKLLVPLVDFGIITLYDVQVFWQSKFEKELRECDVTSGNLGVIDLAGWSIYIAEDVDKLSFINSLIKFLKKSIATIRKPFAKGTTLWEKDYNRLLMIQAVASIAINYIKEIKPEITEKLNYLIVEVETIKNNYPFFKDYSQLHLFNKKITQELN